jgi:hypothetical protein
MGRTGNGQKYRERSAPSVSFIASASNQQKSSGFERKTIFS